MRARTTARSGAARCPGGGDQVAGHLGGVLELPDRAEGLHGRPARRRPEALAGADRVELGASSVHVPGPALELGDAEADGVGSGASEIASRSCSMASLNVGAVPAGPPLPPGAPTPASVSARRMRGLEHVGRIGNDGSEDAIN